MFLAKKEKILFLERTLLILKSLLGGWTYLYVGPLGMVIIYTLSASTKIIDVYVKKKWSFLNEEKKNSKIMDTIRTSSACNSLVESYDIYK